jgi:para-aminobenzoate synthetase/4-amino-4-deoxychorismate lyase
LLATGIASRYPGVRVSLRPDPSKGVFETLLVLDGRPVELEAHLDRLTTSLDKLYEAEMPRGATNEVIARARAIRHGKLRLTVAPAGEGELETQIATAEVEAAKVFPAPERGVALRSHLVEGGLGPHKWADRRLLERAAATTSTGELPLLVDADGAALEASRGSIFSASAGCLTTPPTDGRILPSIARRRALEVARAEGVKTRERRLSLDDLHEAEEVFLVGSVRGVEPVRSLDGVELAPAGEVSSRVAAGLRRRWLRDPQAGSAAVVAVGRPAGPPDR